MDTKKQLDKLVRKLRLWCASPQNDRREQSRKEIRKILASKHPGAAAGAAAHLFHMAVWYGNHGALAILEARSEGWADLERALLFSSLNARLTPNGTLASTAAAHLANALLFEHEELAEDLARLLVASLDGGSFLAWKFSAFGTFMLKLWGTLRGEAIDIARPEVALPGAYQGILNTWQDNADLPQALVVASDYHLDQTNERHAYAEFVQVPYILFPVDILVVGLVRDKLGLSTPHVAHPLLSTPLAIVPPSSQRPRMEADPLLDQVIERAKSSGLLPGKR